MVVLAPRELCSGDVESGTSEVLESVMVLLPRPPSSGIVLPMVVVPKVPNKLVKKMGLEALEA